MEKIIINYRKSIDCEGYVISQTIRLPKSYIEKLNAELAKYQKANEHTDPYACYYKELSIEQIQGERCLFIKQLQVLAWLLKFPKRLKIRNTRLIFTD